MSTATDEVPKAFVVLKAPLTPEEIMTFVASKVAPMDKVRRVEIIDSIPKSPSGKILRPGSWWSGNEPGLPIDPGLTPQPTLITIA